MADFSNLQGYNVKDAYSREKIELLESGINENVKQLEGKKIMIIGDSLTDETIMPPNWITVLKNKINECGVNCIVNTDFCINGESYVSFVVNHLSELDTYTNEWDIIVIELGVNDYHVQCGIGFYNERNAISTQEGYNGYNCIGAQNLLLEKLRNKFPKAIQYTCVPHRSGHTVDNLKIPISAYRYAFGTTAQLYGNRIIDLSSMPMFAPSILGDSFNDYTNPFDKLHPSPEYAPIMCNYILQQINSGGSNYWKISGNQYSIPLKSEISETGEIKCIILSDGTIIYKGAISCDIVTTDGGYVEITDDVPYIYTDFSVYGISCNVYTNTSSDVPTVIKLIGNKFYIRMPKGSTKITQIYIHQTGNLYRPTYDWMNIND